MVWIQLVSNLGEKTVLDLCLFGFRTLAPFVCFHGGEQEGGGCDSRPRSCLLLLVLFLKRFSESVQ